MFHNTLYTYICRNDETGEVVYCMPMTIEEMEKADFVEPTYKYSLQMHPVSEYAH